MEKQSIGDLLLACLSFRPRLVLSSLLLHLGLWQQMLLVPCPFCLQHRSHPKALIPPVRYQQAHVRYFRRLCKDIPRRLQHPHKPELIYLTQPPKRSPEDPRCHRPLLRRYHLLLTTGLAFLLLTNYN